MEISIQKEIDLVNEIIRTAINHGGDQGGAYYTNWDCLQTAIGEWLYARGLADAYTPSNCRFVKHVGRYSNEGKGWASNTVKGA